MLHAMIMAGGGGTRFWPRSRQNHPKQFLALTGQRTLIQLAQDRIEDSVPGERTWVVTGDAYAAEVGRQLPRVPQGQIVGEPCGRDTAACIGLGAALIARRDADATMLVMPADHIIEPRHEFTRGIQVADQLVREQPTCLVTFGIVPTYPARGYGYIYRGPEVPGDPGVPVYRVQGFREKPDTETAARYFASGEYYWNSGIFVWRAATILSELRERQPVLHAAVLRIAEAWDTPQRTAVLRAEYEPLRKISIDYAVMEHARDVLTVHAPFRWDDVGTWGAIERLHGKDAEGNTVQGMHRGITTNGCVIVSDHDHLITTIGVQDLLIVQNGNATLIADKRDEEKVKQMVELLKSQSLTQYL